MWHRNITRLTLETITNSRSMNLSTGTWSRTIISDYLYSRISRIYILSPTYTFFTFLASLWFIFTHNFYESSFINETFLTLEIIFSKAYFHVRNPLRQFDSFYSFWYFTETESHFTDRNQSVVVAAQRKHHSNILCGSGSMRWGWPSTTIRNYCRWHYRRAPVALRRW